MEYRGREKKFIFEGKQRRYWCPTDVLHRPLVLSLYRMLVNIEKSIVS
jgi:hypothetical protein